MDSCTWRDQLLHVTCQGPVGQMSICAHHCTLCCGLTEKEEARQEGEAGPAHILSRVSIEVLSGNP